MQIKWILFKMIESECVNTTFNFTTIPPLTPMESKGPLELSFIFNYPVQVALARYVINLFSLPPLHRCHRLQMCLRRLLRWLL